MRISDWSSDVCSSDLTAPPMRPDSPSPVLPFLVACAGIATYSAMDVLMKGLSIDIGAYNAVLWRTGAGTLLSGLLYFASRPKWPGRDRKSTRLNSSH